MPRRTDLHRILVIGSGPIVIGQGAEFDYSGTQAIKALREEGYEVVLVNSNPATIMTDPEFADRTYIEPVTAEFVEKVIAKERPDAVLPTMGGQTALNVALALYDDGVLQKYGCALIGANARAIRVAEDRKLFAEAMIKIGLTCPTGRTVNTFEEALEAVDATGYPSIINGTVSGSAELSTRITTLTTPPLRASPTPLTHSRLIQSAPIRSITLPVSIGNTSGVSLFKAHLAYALTSIRCLARGGTDAQSEYRD